MKKKCKKVSCAYGRAMCLAGVPGKRALSRLGPIVGFPGRCDAMIAVTTGAWEGLCFSLQTSGRYPRLGG